MLFYNQIWQIVNRTKRGFFSQVSLCVCCTKLILHCSNKIIFWVKFPIWNWRTLILNSNNTLGFVPISAVMMNTQQQKSRCRRNESSLSRFETRRSVIVISLSYRNWRLYLGFKFDGGDKCLSHNVRVMKVNLLLFELIGAKNNFQKCLLGG